MQASNRIYRFLFTAAMGILAGFLSGMLGAGGGIIIVYALSRLLDGEDRSGKTVFANSLAVLLPLALVTSVSYLRGGHIDFAGLMPLVPASVIGGILGGFLLGKISSTALRVVFSAVVIISGFLMLR